MLVVICVPLVCLVVLQLLRAKAIAEGKVIGPHKHQQQDQKVEYESFEFSDGE